MLTEKKMAQKNSTICWKIVTGSTKYKHECLMIPKKGVPIQHSLKKDGQCNRQRKKTKKVVGVWCLTPLSTIFQL
jgi:hypothetical protein